MIVSTTTALDGTPVSEYVGVVTGEAVLGASSSAGPSPSLACTSPGDNENPLRAVRLLDPFLILQRVGLRPYWGTMLA